MKFQQNGEKNTTCLFQYLYLRTATKNLRTYYVEFHFPFAVQMFRSNVDPVHQYINAGDNLSKPQGRPAKKLSMTSEVCGNAHSCWMTCDLKNCTFCC